MVGSFLYIALIVIFAFLTFRKPHAALVAVMCMFGLEQVGQIYIPFLRANGLFTNLFVLFLVAGAVSYTYFSGRLSIGFQYRNCKVRSLSIILFLYAFISLVWTPVDGWNYWRNLWPYIVVSLVMAPLLLNRVSDLAEMQKTFIWVGGVIIVFMAFIPEWSERSLVIEGSDDAIGLPLALAQLAGYLLITAVICFKRSYLNLGWLVLLVIASLFVVLKTNSRGQFIFSILSLFLVMPLVWQRFTLKNALQLSVICGLILLVGYYVFDMTVAESTSWKGGTKRWDLAILVDDFMDRFDLVIVLLSAWIDSVLAIIFGLGNSASISESINGRYPHIVLLEVLGEEGIIGFTLFVTVVMLSFRQAIIFKSLTTLSADLKRAYAALFGCFVFTLLISFKQGSLISSPMLFFFAAVSEKYFYLIKISLYRSKQSLYEGRALVTDTITV